MHADVRFDLRASRQFIFAFVLTIRRKLFAEQRASSTESPHVCTYLAEAQKPVPKWTPGIPW